MSLPEESMKQEVEDSPEETGLRRRKIVESAQQKLAQGEQNTADSEGNDVNKLIVEAAKIAGTPEVDTLIRLKYFEDMRKCIQVLQEPVVIPFGDIFKAATVYVKNEEPIMRDSMIELELVIESNFPLEVICTNLMLSLESDPKAHKKVTDVYSLDRVFTSSDVKQRDPALQMVKMKTSLDYKQDKQLAVARITSKLTEPILKQYSLQQIHKEFNSEFSYCLAANKLPLAISPGLNLIRLRKEANNIGKYNIGQVLIHIGNLHLVSPPMYRRLPLEIKEEPPTLKLHTRATPLLTGIEQIMDLILTIGSYPLEPESKIKLTTSPGLTVQIEPDVPFVSNLEVEVGPNFPFSSTRRSLRVVADVLSKDHQITIHCPWSTKPLNVSLTFTPPLAATWKLYTMELRKYIQVTVVGQCGADIEVEDANLELGGEICDVAGLNCESSQIISNNLCYSYIWELVLKNPLEPQLPTLKADFSVKYKIDDVVHDNGLYQYRFSVVDYQTLYILDTNVTPSKGTEFCRAGAVCQLHISIYSTTPLSSGFQSVMYEVLAESGIWAVCGRTAGVITFNDVTENKGEITLDVMPLTGGYLPFPLVRVSRYIHADTSSSDKTKGDMHPRLEPFSPGQVYNRSKGKQLHIIAATND